MNRKEACIALLKIQVAHTKRSEQLQELGIDIGDPIAQDFTLENLALDLLGVPAENMPDMSFQPERAPEFIQGVHFCRDYLHDKYTKMVEEGGKYAEFVDYIEKVKSAGWKDNENQ